MCYLSLAGTLTDRDWMQVMNESGGWLLWLQDPRLTEFSQSIRQCVPNQAKATLGGAFPLEVAKMHKASKEWKVSTHDHILPLLYLLDKAWYGESTRQEARWSGFYVLNPWTTVSQSLDTQGLSFLIYVIGNNET